MRVVLIRRLIALAAVWGLLSGEPVLAERTDVVTLDNGDEVTCEIKDLTRGKLRVKTDSMGTIYMDWVHVWHLESKDTFQLLLANGEYRFGTLERGERPHYVSIVSGETTVQIPMSMVVMLHAIDSDFWDRVTGSVSLGFNFTKASDIGQLNFFFTPSYRARKYQLNLSLSSINTFDGNAETTQRQNHSFGYTRLLADRWFFGTSLGYEANDELGLNLRASLAGGLGRHLKQTETSSLDAFVGLQGTTEEFVQSEPQQNIEGILRGQYSIYDYDNLIKDIGLDLTLYPSLTDWGRTRARGNARVSWEIVNDFTIDLNLYGDYDSDGDEDAASTDYGIVATFGYKF